MRISRKLWVPITLGMLFVGIPAGLAVAQTGGAEFMPDVWSKIQQAGPFSTAVMIIMYLRSESERRKLLDEKDGLLERALTAINNNTEASRDLRIILFGGNHERQ